MNKSIWIIYHENDAFWKEKLQIPIEAQELSTSDIAVEYWNDARITGSADVKNEFDTGIKNADAIVLLLSKHFQQSPSIKTVAQRVKQDKKKRNIYLVYIDSTDWASYKWMGTCFACPDDETPLSGKSDSQAERYFADFAWKIIQDLSVHPTAITQGILSELVLNGVGPVRHTLKLNPSRRLNIITGDNGLGKSFLLECAWWAFTGYWVDEYVYPRFEATKDEASLQFSLKSGDNSNEELKTIRYNYKRHIWMRTGLVGQESGLVIFACADGSFSFWDPVSTMVPPAYRNKHYQVPMVLTRKQVFDGITKTKKKSKDPDFVFNGLIDDWHGWRSREGNGDSPFNILGEIIKILSPCNQEKFVFGEPMRKPRDARELPSIKYPYGETPVINAADSVQRILSLAYIILWTWEEHKRNCALAKCSTYKNMIVLLDELDCHLHPEWQRTIISSLMKVIAYLDKELDVQYFITTHSPLLLSSLESIFDDKKDKLLLLEMDETNHEIKLEELPFMRRGTMNNWFTSDSFGLNQPRSKEAEEIIIQATELQKQKSPDKKKIEEMHSKLVEILGDFDTFWPGWHFFKNRNGVDE